MTDQLTVGMSVDFNTLGTSDDVLRLSPVFLQLGFLIPVQRPNHLALR